MTIPCKLYDLRQAGRRIVDRSWPVVAREGVETNKPGQRSWSAQVGDLSAGFNFSGTGPIISKHNSDAWRLLGA